MTNNPVVATQNVNYVKGTQTHLSSSTSHHISFSINLDKFTPTVQQLQKKQRKSECKLLRRAPFLMIGQSGGTNEQHDRTAQVEINHVVGTWRERKAGGRKTHTQALCPQLACNKPKYHIL